MSGNRSQYKNCVQRCEGETGKTFHHIARFIVRTRPRLASLENVPGLLEKTDEPGSLSDVEYIERYFEDNGFAVFCFRLYAEDHGSLAARDRLLFMIVNKDSIVILPGPLLSFANEVIAHMKTDVEPFSTFALSTKARAYWCDMVPHPGKNKRPKESDGWVDRHMEVFHKYQVPWPARSGLFDEELRSILSDRAQDCFPANTDQITACMLGFGSTLASEVLVLLPLASEVKVVGAR